MNDGGRGSSGFRSLQKGTVRPPESHGRRVWSHCTGGVVLWQVRATQLHAEMVNDPAGITGESLLNLLDATVNGKIIGNDPETGGFSSESH